MYRNMIVVLSCLLLGVVRLQAIVANQRDANGLEQLLAQ